MAKTLFCSMSSASDCGASDSEASDSGELDGALDVSGTTPAGGAAAWAGVGRAGMECAASGATASADTIHPAGTDAVTLDRLLAPGRIGTLETRNRIVMAPMGSNLCEPDGTPGARMTAYYEARARGGARRL